MKILENLHFLKKKSNAAFKAGGLKNPGWGKQQAEDGIYENLMSIFISNDNEYGELNSGW